MKPTANLSFAPTGPAGIATPAVDTVSATLGEHPATTPAAATALFLMKSRRDEDETRREYLRFFMVPPIIQDGLTEAPPAQLNAGQNNPLMTKYQNQRRAASVTQDAGRTQVNMKPTNRFVK